GLANQLNKKPSQMSGGQMQRVAIARALVNNPDIILADEPTGALDSKTSVQIMDILREIAKSKLVIMVTHNNELAQEYSTRIIELKDGEVLSDSNPLFKDAGKKIASDKLYSQEAKTLKKTSMSMWTATSLSLRNLLTKKGRTLITSFAGSIGIIGVALVLALSSGLSSYINDMQSDTLSGFPITISRQPQSIQMGPSDDPFSKESEKTDKFPNDDIIYNYDSTEGIIQHTNILTEDYLSYIEELPDVLPGVVNTISYSQGVGMNVLAKGSDTVVLYSSGTNTASDQQADSRELMNMTDSSYWQEMPDNQEFITSLYDLIGEGSRFPENKNEVLLVVDEYNRIDNTFFEKLGITSGEDYKLTDFIGKELLTVVPNNDFYNQTDELFTAASTSDYDKLYDSENSIKLTVTGILRLKEDAGTSYFSEGFVYTTALTQYMVENAKNSTISKAQVDSDKNVFTGITFADDKVKEQQLIYLGADTTPTSINIYPKDFESKDKIIEYLDAYNTGKSEEQQITYSDMAEMITSMTGTLINTISYVLIGFAAISLFVSTIMIAIITYVSVIERTKEIGILRAVGARKKDISRVFNAETLLIGFTAGILGIGITYLLSLPINVVIKDLVGISNIASLSPIHAAILVLGSMGLTLIAGLIPSKIAAKKDPVVALRSDV
ncbi:MAG TPA: FtsX-like permease family protein, partial [Lachnospiraceae bacterium]|nr:FtsX-like permease family protein [Lachnospiraceae bacterium]